MLPIENILLYIGILLLLSVFSSKISDKMAVPALLAFIVIGMLAGSEGLGGIYFDDPWIAKFIGIVALNFIIFFGGMETDWKHMRSIALPGVMLATLGVVITALVTGLFAAMIMGWSLIEGLLLGAIVSSTDAAAVFSILRSRHIHLKGTLQPLLELESGSNDPMAAFLTLGFLGILANQGVSLVGLLPLFLLDMVLGLIIGYIMSRIGIYLMNRLHLGYHGLYPVLSIALMLIAYAIATIIKGNGFIAVYLVGLLMSREEFQHKKNIQKFHEGWAWLMQIAMFLTLGLLVFPSQAISMVSLGVLISAALIFAARPLAVFLCLLPFKMPINEKLLVSWVGLKGAAAIILAIFPLLTGIGHAKDIFNVVFVVVLISVFFQGTSIPYVSRLLKVDLPLQE
ncbi:MAG: potassium/proton antiporter [Syntrophales bacterium]